MSFEIETCPVSWVRASPLRLWFLLIGYGALAGGCAPEVTRAGPMIRDSAGVAIVENESPVWTAGEDWHLAQDPFLDLGLMDGDTLYQFYQVAGAIRMPDGRLAVGNGGTGEIRFYDGNGAYLGATLGKGSGPGEFEDIFFVEKTRGDSLLAYDWRNRRLSVMDPFGRFARSFDFTVLTTAGGFPIVTEPFPDGDILLATDMFSASPEPTLGAKRDSAVYYIIGPDGETVATLGSFPGGESYETTDGENWVGGGLVFGRFGFAAVSGSGFYYGSSDTYEVEYRDKAGKLRRLVRLKHENLPVTQGDIDRYVADRMERARPDRRQIYQAMFENMPFPSIMPAYSDFLVDAEENLWVGEYRRPGDPAPRWRIFDPGGAYLGVVETPERFRIFEIGADYLLGRWSDELDVEHIRLYALVKP